jgi:hypothetical protein
VVLRVAPPSRVIGAPTLVGLKTGMAAGFADFASAPSDLAASFSAAYVAEVAKARLKAITETRVFMMDLRSVLLRIAL